MVTPVKLTHKRPIQWWLTLLFGLLIANISMAADLTASVDRKVVGENDTFTLLLRYNEQVSFRSPDLSPLEKDFRVLNKKQSTQFRSINGNSEYFTDWAIVLSPQKTGKITIPAIRFNGASTQPIVIDVQPVSASVKEKLAKEFFFDISVSEGPVYVQGQILYTEKFYYTTSPEGASLSDFKVTDARVQQLGEVRSYQTIIEGQRFGVFERQFAVFPEESGTLVIPGQRFSGRISNPYDRWSRGQPLSVVSKPIEINVLPIPAEYPQSPWLPSTKVSIRESFSDNNQNWTVGEPITRSIILKAQGLSGSQLPAIALPVVDKLRYYPDQSNHSETVNEAGINGELEQSMAVVPTAAGRLVLPEIRVPWWNTRLQKTEYAVLPSRTIEVQAATQTADSAAIGSTATDTTASNPGHTQQQSSSSFPLSHNGQGIWVIVSALLLITNLLSAFGLWRVYHRNPEKPTQKPDSLHREKDSWKAFQQACRANNANTIRTSMIAWAKLRYPDNHINQLTQLKQLSNEPKLHAALDELNAHLYAADNSSAFNGGNLLALVKNMESHQINNRVSSELKPLYGA